MKQKLLNSIRLRAMMLVALLCATFTGTAWADDVTDELTASDFAATSTTYTDFSGVSKTSDAVYAGNSAKDASGNIQLRSKNSNSGIVSTTSGGKVKSITITVGSGSNTVDVYGSNTAYTAASDLYGNSKGTKLGSVSATGTINVTDDYEYVGIRSNSGAIYLSKIEIVWTTSGGGSTTYSVTYDDNGKTSGSVPTDATAYSSGATVTVLGNTGSLAKTGYSFGGWNTQNDGQGTNYTAGNTFAISANTTLYAKWTPYTITAQSNNNTLGTVSASGFVITASPAAGSTYADPAYTVSGTATVAQDGNTFTVTPSSDCTVTINFAAIPTHTLSSAVSPGGAGSVTLGSASVWEGGTTTATAAANSGYKFTGWSISGTGASLSSTSTNPTTVTMGTADATITANFEAVVTHQVKWSVNGQITTDNVEVGTAITFPDDPADVNGKTFRGWATATIDGTTDDAPDFVTSANMGNSDITYYAVFAEVLGEASWVEATLASMTSTDVFVFASGNYAMKNDGGTSAPTPVSITVTDGKISSAVTDAMKWKVSGNAEDGYTFLKGDDTTKWLYCSTTASSGSNNNIAVGTGNRKLWVFNNSGYLVTNDNYTARYLSMYNTQDFRGYTGTGNGAFVPTFYKYQGPTYSNYTTDARAEAGISFANASIDVQLTSEYTGQVLTNPNSLTVSYSSSDATVATIDSGTGEITELLKAGSTNITASFAGNATYKAAVASYTLNVTEKTPAGLTYAKTEVAKSYGDENFTNALSNPNNLDGVTYGSSNTGVATVDEDGEVTIKAVGSTTITATFAGDATYDAGNASYILTVSKATPTLNFAAANITGHIGEAVSANGLTNPANLTVSYSSSDETVATVNSSTGVVANPLKAGTTTITASFAGNANYEAANASYTLKVLANPTINVSDDNVDYGKTYTFDASALSSYGAVTLTSGNTAIATVDGLTITSVACGTVTITVSTAENEDYRDGSATFALTINAPAGSTTAEQIVFNETFAASTGGPLSTWGGSEANGTLTTDIGGWDNVSGAGAGSCAKFGANKTAGSATTPSITVENGGTYQLSFKAAPWSTESSTITVAVSGGTINGNASATTSTMSTQQWNDYNYDIVATSTSMTITFSASNNRFFLDEVKVTKPVPAVTVQLNTSGYGTFCSVNPMDFSETEGYTAWRISSIDMDGTTGTVNCVKITEAIKGGQGVLLYNKNAGGVKTNVTVTFADGTTEFDSDQNWLVGTTAPTFVKAGEVYGLSGNAFVPSNAAGVIPAGKAYLDATSIPANVKAFIFMFNDETTGITETRKATREEVESIFNLGGQRVDGSRFKVNGSGLKTGIYIVNGKKVLVK